MPMKMTMISKCIKKYSCVRYLVGVCMGSVVLASSARVVKEMCDSFISVTKVLVFSLRIPYS